jgi:hypothetical protein
MKASQRYSLMARMGYATILLGLLFPFFYEGDRALHVGLPGMALCIGLVLCVVGTVGSDG